MSRPSKMTPELLEAIGTRLGEGEPLTHICRDLDVSDDTVRNWMGKDAEVSRVIACAREDGEQAIAFRLRETARGRGDSTGEIARDRLIIETDLKLLSKWNPKKYGDRLDLTVKANKEVRDLSTEELLALVGAERASGPETGADEPRQVH